MTDSIEELERLYTLSQEKNRLYFEKVTSLCKRVAALEEALERLDEWSKACPLAVFPEPDLKIARKGLESVGITMDQMSASSMRHVITRVGEIARAALEDSHD